MKNFKFFRGSHKERLWWPDEDGYTLREDVTNQISEEIRREIDENVVIEVARRINNGHHFDMINRFNMLEELERNINGIGGNRA